MHCISPTAHASLHLKQEIQLQIQIASRPAKNNSNADTAMPIAHNFKKHSEYNYDNDD
jgi:hypothetical protein